VAVEALRSGPGTFPVGLTLSMAELVAVEGGEDLRDGAQEVLEDTFLAATGGDDFIGVQSYTRIRFGPKGLVGPEEGVRSPRWVTNTGPRWSSSRCAGPAAVTGLPVVVTENGIGTEDDTQRIAYISAALAGVRRCLDDGLDVRGYFAWSLLEQLRVVCRVPAEVRSGCRGPSDLRAAAETERSVVRRGSPEKRAGRFPGLIPSTQSSDPGQVALPAVADPPAHPPIKHVWKSEAPLGERLSQIMRHPSSLKLVKYASVSIISTIVSQVTLLLTFGVFHLMSEVPANLLANVVATPPSYYLNRKWVWGRAASPISCARSSRSGCSGSPASPFPASRCGRRGVSPATTTFRTP